MNQKIKLAGILFILIALPLTVFLARRVQDYVNHAAGPTYFAEYYVSPLGNDSNLGTEPDKPFKTIEKARDSVRSIKSGMTSDIVVYLRGGTYDVGQTINFTNQDSGINGYNIIYKNYQDEIPILSGGKQVGGWVADTQPGVFKTNLKAQLGADFDSRQFYVNGVRAVRAREETSIPNAYIPPHTPGTEPSTQGFYTTDTGMQGWGNKQNIEIVRIIRWRMYRCPLEDIVPSLDPRNPTKQVSLIKVSEPCWNIANIRSPATSELGMGAFTINNPASGYFPPYLENARELLDQQGEWYFDKTSGYLYYKPRAGENMTTAYTVIPKTETLISVVGTTQQNTENLSFQGLTFEYTTWLSPNSQGYIENQGGSIYRPFPGLSPALKISYSNSVFVESNRFLHLGANGINPSANQKLSITGNHFEDISGSAIISNTNNLDNILNNYITNVANEYQSASALRIDMKDTKISHNEIHDVSYTGIEPNCLTRDKEGKLKPPPAQNIISNNLIYNVMKIGFDGGGIHTRCAQEGTKINQNVVYGQPSHVVGFIYVDFYSGFLEIAQNVIFDNDAMSIFLYLTGDDYVHDNWLNPKPSPTGCLYNSDPCYRPYNPNPYGAERIENNTTIHSLSDAMAIPAAAAIINDAGLEDAYKDIKKLPECIAKNSCLVQLPSPTPTPTPFPTKPIVGVIRWDAWTPNQLTQDPTKPNPVGIVQLSSDPKWHYRLPFFADENNKTFAINEDNQSTIDQEILYTSAAGISYWAFDWYNFWWQNNNPSWHYNYGLNYYLNSPYKSKMNFALTMMCCGGVDHYPNDWKTVYVPKLVNLVKQPTYQKVLNGRPLIYMFGASNLRAWFNCGIYETPRYGTCADTSFASSSAALQFLRDKVQEAGLSNPYLVAMVWDPLNKNYTSSAGYGFDAISSYSGHNANIDGLTQKTYQDLASDNIVYRERAKTAGNKIIPPMNAGWDRRPDPDYNKVWYDAGTPAQVGANLKAAIDWNKVNPTLAETNSVLIYAWNEFSEGGWLGPTIEDKGARLNAIADVLGGTHVTPIPTPTPTRTPTPTSTRVPTPTPRPSVTPTSTPNITPTPTPTSPPGTTAVNLTIGLDGIGITSRIPLGGNKNPLRKTRTLEVKIYKADDNSLVSSESQVFSFNSSTNRFDASISLPSSFETGIYNIYALGNPFLTGRYPGSVTITKGQTTTLNSDSFNLITGDVNKNQDSINKLNILDYNVLVLCSVFTSDQSNCNQNPDYKINSDLNDNGVIDQDDLTLLIKEMGNQSGDILPGD